LYNNIFKIMAVILKAIPGPKRKIKSFKARTKTPRGRKDKELITPAATNSRLMGNRVKMLI
jgi:hypothetical protein